MAQIKNIDRATVRTLNEKLQEKMREFAEENGLEFEAGNVRFNSEEMTTKVTFRVKGEGEEAGLTAQERNFKMAAVLYGLKEEWLGRSFKQGRKVLTITGWNNRARKDHVQLVDQNGKKFKAPADFVKQFADQLDK